MVTRSPLRSRPRRSRFARQRAPTLRSRPTTNPSLTRSLVVHGHTVYALTADAKVEVEALGRQSTAANADGPVTTLTLPGSPTLSRPPAVEDDRLVVVDDAGQAFVVNLANTTADTPTIATTAQGAVASFPTAAADTTRFGDVELRGGRLFVTRALTDNTASGFFSATLDAVTGQLDGLCARTRAFGALAADGCVPTGAVTGAAAGVVDVSSDLTVLTSWQAVLAPFDLFVLGPVLVSVNRDAGVETLILSR